MYLCLMEILGRSAFGRKVESIAREGKHQHLIIESTGISDPNPVAEALVASDEENGESTETSRESTEICSTVGQGSHNLVTPGWFLQLIAPGSLGLGTLHVRGACTCCNGGAGLL